MWIKIFIPDIKIYLDGEPITENQFLQQHKIYHHECHKNVIEVHADNFL